MTNRPNPRPIISELRGSADLEHAADAVVQMHRGEKKHQSRVIKASDVDFILAKNRQGEEGTCTLRFEGQ